MIVNLHYYHVMSGLLSSSHHNLISGLSSSSHHHIYVLSSSCHAQVLVQLTDEGTVNVLSPGSTTAHGSTSTTSSTSTSTSSSNSNNNSDSESRIDHSDSSTSSDSTGPTDNTDPTDGVHSDALASAGVGVGITGLRWFFKPGPAHLDTLEFSIVSDPSSSPDVFLRYTGFIDRYVVDGNGRCCWCWCSFWFWLGVGFSLMIESLLSLCNFTHHCLHRWTFSLRHLPSMTVHIFIPTTISLNTLG